MFEAIFQIGVPLALLAVIIYLLGMATGGSVWALLRKSFQGLPRGRAS